MTLSSVVQPVPKIQAVKILSFDIPCNINEPKKKTTTWQKKGVKLYKLHADNSGNHIDITSNGS